VYVTKDINKVILGGTVINTPELRTTGNGTKVTNFVLQTVSEIPHGDAVVRMHKIIGWGQVAQEIVSSIAVGQRVTVEGELTYHNDKDGVMVAEIKAYRLFI